MIRGSGFLCVPKSITTANMWNIKWRRLLLEYESYEVHVTTLTLKQRNMPDTSNLPSSLHLKRNRNRTRWCLSPNLKIVWSEDMQWPINWYTIECSWAFRLQRHVLPGTRIWSDEWGAYNNLNGLGYIHETVNHSMHFIDPISGCHTNDIESRSASCKASFNVQRHTLPSYIDEYIQVALQTPTNKHLFWHCGLWVWYRDCE